jgi:biopolymer transport protein ExbB
MLGSNDGKRPRVLTVLLVLVAVWQASVLFAQDSAPADGLPAEETTTSVSLWTLFSQSFDVFTVLLVLCSLIVWTVIIRSVIELRERSILRAEAEQTIRRLGEASQWDQVEQFVANDKAFVSKVVKAGLNTSRKGGGSVRESAELAASEECARLFRTIEPLNIIGNLGPLLGLSGTVYGMVIAFAALGQAGGQASPANLSLGISKALFHTLLGLLVAVPALAVFGFYRTRIDKLCNRAMAVASELTDLLPAVRSAHVPPPVPKRAPVAGGARLEAAARPTAPAPAPVPKSPLG